MSRLWSDAVGEPYDDTYSSPDKEGRGGGMAHILEEVMEERKVVSLAGRARGVGLGGKIPWT